MNYNYHIIQYLELAMGTQRLRRRRMDKMILRKILLLHRRWAKEVEAARGNKPAWYLPGNTMPDLSLLPPVEEMAEAFPEMAENFKVVDPLTGEQLVLEAEAAHADV